MLKALLSKGAELNKRGSTVQYLQLRRRRTGRLRGGDDGGYLAATLGSHSDVADGGEDG